MVRVFSFTLFGSQDKYCKGLLKNIAIIEDTFPGWEAWVYCGDDIPEDIYLSLSEHSCVKLIPTKVVGMENKFYRFFSIDIPTVEINIVRDTDSRITERDQACIQDFLQSDKLVHIIRDHPNHHHRMMAGMWGIKQEAVATCLDGQSIQSLFTAWKQSQSASGFWSDTEFLCQVLYPHVHLHSLIHDELQHFEPHHVRTPFRVPLVENHFIGQVYEFDDKGVETQKFQYNES